MPAFLVLLLADLVLFFTLLLGVEAFCGDEDPWAGAAAAPDDPPWVLCLLLAPPADFLAPPALFVIFFDPAAFFVLLAPPVDFLETFPLAI